MTKPGDSQTKSETDYILEIENVKKEADKLMMNKLSEIEDLKNRIADLEESLKSKDYFERPDYKFLVEENLNLRRRITELEQEVLETKADNTKMARQVDDQISQLRRAGLL
jgi:cell division septum initiation protein DivIVA